MTPAFKDGLGNLIAVGDFISYVWRHSSSCGFALGKVLELCEDGQIKVVGLDYRGKKQRPAKLQRLDRVIVLPYTLLPVAALDELTS